MIESFPNAFLQGLKTNNYNILWQVGSGYQEISSESWSWNSISWVLFGILFDLQGSSFLEFYSISIFIFVMSYFCILHIFVLFVILGIYFWYLFLVFVLFVFVLFVILFDFIGNFIIILWFIGSPSL